MVTRVLADANVLFSRTLRDWLFLLKLETDGEIFTVATTVDIVAETVARIRDARPALSGGAVTRIHDLIVASVDERIDQYTVDLAWPGADEGDAHVHAAATDGRVDILVTLDRGWSRLTSPERDALHYDVLDPDEFFCLIEESAPAAVGAVVLQQVRHWFKRNGSVDLPGRLRLASCPRFAELVRRHLQRIDPASLCG